MFIYHVLIAGASVVLVDRKARASHFILASSCTPRELGPPALIMEEPLISPTRSSPPRQHKEEGPIYGELVVLG